MMNRRRVIEWLSIPALACAGWLGVTMPAWAQATSPLRFIVPYPPGGGSDRAARILAEALQPRLGTTIVVENVTGAGGRLAMRQVAGQGDTNVLVFANPALMVVAPLVYKNNGYDPERDFQPVAQISTYEFAAAVGGAVPCASSTT